MTEKLYYTDSKMKDFDAEVLSCEWDEQKRLDGVILDRTAFFPESGGQYADRGFLNGCEVEDARERGNEIIHYTAQAFSTGQTVHGEIDYEERYSRMQQHSGEHIVSGIVHSWFGYDNVGFHLGSSVTTMDFNGPLSSEQITQIETAVNRAVTADLPILVSYPSPEELASLDYRSKKELTGQVRIVTIPGVDVCACCAPHVDRTGEIGLVKLVDFMKYKGGTRIYMLAGSRALNDYRDREKSVREISRLLSVKPDEVAAAVRSLQEEEGRLKGKISQMQSQFLEERLDQITPDTASFILFEDDIDKYAARRFVDAGMRKVNGICGIFVGNDTDGYNYILGSEKRDLRDFLPDFHEACQGRGGGKAEMVQGSVRACRSVIEEYLKTAAV